MAEYVAGPGMVSFGFLESTTIGFGDTLHKK